MGRSNGQLDAAKSAMGRSTAPRFSNSQRAVDPTVINKMTDRESRRAMRGIPMPAFNDPDLDNRIERKLRTLGLLVRDEWHDAESAASYLRLSKAHFLRVANGDKPPDSSGHGRMRRWKTSALDQWQMRTEKTDD